MKIDVLARDGSPLGVCLDDLYGENGRVGVGGAESALLTMCEAWHNANYDVTLYNNPTHQGSPFKQRGINEFNPQEPRDILIVFRSPNPAIVNAKGKKLWWSCDQYTIDNFKEFSKLVDEIIVISEFHANYFETMYGIRNVKVIDLPVRGEDYDSQKCSISKVSKQCLFSSVPDRGLPILAELWPRIVEQVPEASLIITSGWSLWTGMSDAQYLAPYRLQFNSSRNVSYLGAIPRRELVKYQLQSDLFLFPCTYDELFCIACSEAQWAGAWPITSSTGALNTTNMGTRLMGNPTSPEWKASFVDEVVKKLNADNLVTLQGNISYKARERFNLKRIMRQWENAF